MNKISINISSDDGSLAAAVDFFPLDLADFELAAVGLLSDVSKDN
jgi:hypothetical protein